MDDPHALISIFSVIFLCLNNRTSQCADLYRQTHADRHTVKKSSRTEYAPSLSGNVRLSSSDDYWLVPPLSFWRTRLANDAGVAGSGGCTQCHSLAISYSSLVDINCTMTAGHCVMMRSVV